MLLTVIAVAFVLTKIRFQGNQGPMDYQLETLIKNLERIERDTKANTEGLKNEVVRQLQANRTESSTGLKQFNDSLIKQMADWVGHQTKQISDISKENEARLTKMNETIEKRLGLLQEDNNKKLEQMRLTVDEKLHTTLEKRLGESFKLVSDQLALSHKSMGEMQQLFAEFGDFKKVLTNVKTRGVWGEMQLENLIGNILTSDQYARNVKTKKGSNDYVEFAIKMYHKGQSDQIAWLPIDSKFPLELYQRLIEAQDQVDKALIEEIKKQIEAQIKLQAKDIRDKYLDPPSTMDFAILYIPIESLYSEILSRPGLHENISQQYRITIAGPSTLSAMLNTIQMGFRAMAIEQRAHEVWNVLGTVKGEFGKFGEILEKTQKKIQEVSNTMDLATRKSRTIERKLRDVEALPTDPQAASFEISAPDTRLLSIEPISESIDTPV